jgi:hypothetical protein
MSHDQALSQNGSFARTVGSHDKLALLIKMVGEVRTSRMIFEASGVIAILVQVDVDWVNETVDWVACSG